MLKKINISTLSAMKFLPIILLSNFGIAATAQNPLLLKWDGPHNGVPPFGLVSVADFKPALEAAMQENLQEIEKIANNPAPADFENTIAAMERSGKTLNRVRVIYGIWSSNMSSPEFQPLQREMEPVMAGFADKITQNEKLFARIATIYESDKNRLNAEQQRLVWRYYTNFVRAGAKLDATSKKRLSEINQQLAGLFTRFSQNLLADESQYLELKNVAELDGLPQSAKDAAANSANAKKLSGSWIIQNTRSSVEPFLTYSSRRDIREKVYKMFINRGDNGGEHDNNNIITEILKLRAERAKLLGYKTHAHWRLENAMAKTPDRAMELMETVWKPAVARVHEEVADMQAIADKEGANIKIAPWDYRYYAEKVRKAKYDLDQNEVKPYLQLEKMREGMFWMAGELFGFNFTQVNDVPVYHPDVRVWKVNDRTSGKQVGLWYFDPYAREGKKSGAWMNAYRNQERMDENITTIVSNNSNFIAGKPGEAVLISWEDATTLFHEFGHALHGLSSDVTYPTLAGTQVARDYVEFPSQILENWLSTPQILQKFALHYKTGEPIPQQLVDRINNASKFNQGFATVEYLSAALIDMKLHLSDPGKIDPDEFERKTLKDLNMPEEIVMRHRTPQFAHAFSSDGYSAGYYSYLWSEVLSADAYQAFEEAGGPYDREVAARLTQYVFSVGNTMDHAEAYRKFRGHDPATDALMKHRGFPVKGSKEKKEK
jgi:peptidyl-dipeptidase Dcp